MNGAVERLAFRDPAAQYHAYDAATHVARYLSARPFCAGKRVLDIACGEGYGSFLLAQWGAEAVFGIDISAAAIDSANVVFTHDRVRFIAGSETSLDELVSGHGPFDVILSLETIEHVPDPAALLRRLRNQLAPGGILLVSCPNEPDAGAAKADNPFHLSHWTFEGFREFTEAILGPAGQWLLETPIIGVTLQDAFRPATYASGGNPRDMVRGSLPREALVMPAQHNVVPGPDDCIAFLGIWGATAGEVVTCAAVSLSGYLQPWREMASQGSAIVSLNENIAGLTRTVATLRDNNAALAETTERLLREQQEDRRQLLHYAALLAREQQEDRRQLLHYTALLGHGPQVVGLEASRVFQVTGSRRIARLYIRLFTPPVAKRLLWAARRASRGVLRRGQR